MTLPFNRPVPRTYGLLAVRCPISGQLKDWLRRDVFGKWASGQGDDDTLDLSRANQADRRARYRRKH